MNRIFFSSNDQAWQTPPVIFNDLNREFRFELDAAASAQNSLCKKFISKEDDAVLMDEWPASRIWLNPPYNRNSHFMEKAVEQSLMGKLIVALIFVRSDTQWWHDWVMPYASEIRLVKGRIYFSKADGTCGPATSPSCIIVFPPYRSNGVTFSTYIQPKHRKK